MSRGCVLTLMLMLGVAPRARAEKPLLEGVVNLNTATPEQLQLLTGIGPARVRNILAYRQKHPFRTVEELARIKGIGRKSVRHLRMHLAVAGPTTAQKIIRPAGPDVTPAPAPVPPRPVKALAPPRSPAPLAGRPAPAAVGRPLAKPVHRKGEPAHQLVTANRGSDCLPAP